MGKPSVIFLLSIDTEEEWLWDEQFPDDDFSVKNVDRIPDFQRFCQSKGIRNTYFVDYAVANNPHAKDIMTDVARNPYAEIGAHLHPWCNPPYFGKTTEFESHVINLPDEQVVAKLDTLTDMLIQKFNVIPTSFRSGRWGIDGRSLKLLSQRGYKVDSSVYPFFKNEFFSCEGASALPFWPDFAGPKQTGEQRDIIEIPVSAGFNRSSFNAADRVHRALSSPQLSWTRAIGLLWHIKALRKLYLSPELTSADDMCSLIDACLANHHPVIHMYLHSSSLIDGATGLLDKQNAFQVICQRIEHTLTHLQSKANVSFATISEAAILLQQADMGGAELTWQEGAL